MGADGLPKSGDFDGGRGGGNNVDRVYVGDRDSGGHDDGVGRGGGDMVKEGGDG